ncbi:hypothetical protein MTO96_003101 [Rhipicephalus appendiculatus]
MVPVIRKYMLRTSRRKGKTRESDRKEMGERDASPTLSGTRMRAVARYTRLTRPSLLFFCLVFYSQIMARIFEPAGRGSESRQRAAPTGSECWHVRKKQRRNMPTLGEGIGSITQPSVRRW